MTGYLYSWLKVLYVSFLLPVAFDLCGNYCGPNWCSGKIQSETSCVDSGHFMNSTDPIDECCKFHDMCCGSKERGVHCNQAIELCLEKINGTGGCSKLNEVEMEILFIFLKNSVCGSFLFEK